jgi:cysteine-rich repeat protein
MKAKGAGKAAAGLLKAFGKNVKKQDDAKLGQAISKAQSKFAKSFAKAEDKGDCLTTADVGPIEDKVELFVCRAIDSVTPAVCGNNCTGVGEECDGTDDALCSGICQPDCTCPEAICGNAVVEAGEECDDGDVDAGDGCDGSCRTEERIVDQAVSPWETVTTDEEADGATPSDPVETAVTVGAEGGIVTIVETSTTTTPPTGFSGFVDRQVEITAPNATPAHPLEITFWLHASILPSGTPQVLKNRLPAPACTAPGATADLCVFAREAFGDDTKITVRTTTGSRWNFGVTHCGNGGDPEPGEECDDGNLVVRDGCDWACRIEDLKTDTVGAGETVTTDDDGEPGATDGDIVETTLKHPVGGTVEIVETSTTAEPEPGWDLVSQHVAITAPAATAMAPLELIFRLDASLGNVLTQIRLQLIRVFRDDQEVAQCDDPGQNVASPDPCEVSRAVESDGDVSITVLTSTASVWTFGGKRFVDNGDGTITDGLTGLMWEKKDLSGGIHDKYNTYTWSTGPPWNPDGTAFTLFLDTLNNTCDGDESTACTTNATCTGIGNGLCGHAGYRDWRLPLEDGCNDCYTGYPAYSCPCDPAELETILLRPYPCGPCIDEIFGPTGSVYWSSTTRDNTPSNAWYVHFQTGTVGYAASKDVEHHARAVRDIL